MGVGQKAKNRRLGVVVPTPKKGAGPMQREQAGDDHLLISDTRSSAAGTIAKPFNPWVTSGDSSSSSSPIQRFWSTNASCHSGFLDTTLSAFPARLRDILRVRRRLLQHRIRIVGFGLPGRNGEILPCLSAEGLG